MLHNLNYLHLIHENIQYLKYVMNQSGYVKGNAAYNRRMRPGIFSESAAHQNRNSPHNSFIKEIEDEGHTNQQKQDKRLQYCYNPDSISVDSGRTYIAHSSPAS